MQPSPGTPPPTKSNRNFQSSRRGGLALPDPSFLHFLPKEEVPPPPRVFWQRVRTRLKRKGIDRRHAETLADLNCTNFEEGVHAGVHPTHERWIVFKTKELRDEHFV